MREEKQESNGISRRTFVKGVGIGAAAIAGAAALQPLAAQGAKEFTAATVPESSKLPMVWDLEADVVVIGAGAVGLPAAIRARDAGASVIVVDTNYDIGGHAIISEGNCPMGGGTSFQKKYGIKDDPETYFKDLTDWSVVEVGGMPEYRYNDPQIQHSLAYNMAPAFEFLLENGVPFEDKAPDNKGAHATGISARREHHTIWTDGVSAGGAQSLESPAGSGGTKLMRSLENSARKKGVKILLNYHMDVIYRETPADGRVLGIKAHYTPTILPGTSGPLRSYRSDGNVVLSQETVTVQAKKAIIIGTGGSTGNVDFRRMFDPRLTEEVALAGGEYSPQDASGELAAMAVGAGLWGTANHTMDRNGYLRKRPIVASRTNYVPWTPDSPIFPKIKYTGLKLSSWQHAIIVNQVGKRFYNEMENGYPNGTHEGFYDEFGGYVHGDWRNTRKINYGPMSYADAALAMNEGSAAPDFSAGPQWAIFDSATVKREKWNLADPDAADPELFFSAPTLEELAGKLNACPYQKHRMDGKILAETVRKYNLAVENKKDEEFDKLRPMFKIEEGPFYAAWATIVVHDTYAGLRINDKCQVLTMKGDEIPGLYCGGESAGGSSQHGLARCLAQGYIAGGAAVASA